MSDYQTLILEKPSVGVALLRFNRPEVRNALSWQMMAEFQQALAEIDSDNDCRVLVLTGEGDSFCAGLDLLDQANPDSIATVVGELKSGSRAGMRSQGFMSQMIPLMREIQQPIIAAINGHAYGGGLGIALAADIRIAARSAKFCSQFIRLGVSGCDVGVSYTLPHLIGAARAHDMMISARVIDSKTAERWGLVTRLADDESLLADALQLAESLCDFSPYGLISTKQAMWSNLDAGSLQQAIAMENRNQILNGLSGDVEEAAAAFFEKRKPDFS